MMIINIFSYLIVLCYPSIQGYLKIDKRSILNNNKLIKLRPLQQSMNNPRDGKPMLSGKIVITGIGKKEEDEFMLNLLNEQNVWNTVLLAVPEEDLVNTKKRFLSRTARYSGLLNILEFDSVNLTNESDVTKVLEGATAWLAFNMTQENVITLSDTALKAGIKRVVFTVELPPHRMNDTVIPEFDSAIASFQNKGVSFTGIRHGTIIPGDEDNSYEIVNATTPCIQNTIEQGVLARVVSELLRVDSSFNQQCGLSSSSAFAAAYLSILRSSGLTRKQEVEKIFKGGIQRVAQLTAKEYEAQRQRNIEAKAQEEKERLEEAIELEKEKNETLALQARSLSSDSTSLVRGMEEDPDDPAVDFDTELDYSITTPEMITNRANEILMNVWKAMDVRMYSKSTSKAEFFESNMEKARALAEKEIEEERIKAKNEELEKEAMKLMFDRVTDVERKQYAKLLSLEKKEMQNQKEISDTWVRYIYFLLEYTMEKCQKENVLFHNMDEFQQTIYLRKMANELRFKCKLPSYEVIYDPLDASVIVKTLVHESSLSPMNNCLHDPIDDVVKLLNSKYSDSLKSVTALRGASQIIELAIETLRKELPPPPPTVNEIRATESSSKAQATTLKKLEAVRNRGKPFSEGDSKVGRM